MTAEPLPSRYPNLPGFDKRNRELVYAMIDAGWKGRITSKRHYMGKAPDGKTQITVPSKDGNNRGYENAHAQFMRWVKAHVTPEIKEVWDAAIETDNPILKDILADSIVKKQTEQLVSEQMERAHKEFIEAMKNDPRIIIEPLIRPWLARKNPGQNGGTRYESQAVLERVWPDGRPTDYQCAFPGCDWTSDKPQSVARHYAGHTKRGDTPPAEMGPVHPDPTYTEPTTTRDYRPTERLIMAAAEAIRSLMDDEEATPESVARAFLEWAHYRDDIDHEPRPLVPLTDRQILDKIRVLVGQPDQSEEIEGLKAENLELANQIVRLKEERAALRDLLTEE